MSKTAVARHSRSKSRKQARLTGELERRVKDYSLAAAGVGALAFASPATATIATTNLNLNVPLNNGQILTLDGVNILSIFNYTNSSFDPGVRSVFVSSLGPGDAIFAGNGGARDISPVAAGQPIPGAQARFTNYRTLVSSTRSIEGEFGSSWTGFLGNTKYLGFSFGTGANLHYGWLKLNISQNENHSYAVTMVQAAYEQCANQAITAGTTTGGATCSTGPSPTPAPNTLWLMALGAAGLAGLEVLRRRKTA